MLVNDSLLAGSFSSVQKLDTLSTWLTLSEVVQLPFLISVGVSVHTPRSTVYLLPSQMQALAQNTWHLILVKISFLSSK